MFINILYSYHIPVAFWLFFSGSFWGQWQGRSHLSCSECLNLCGPAFILWLTYSVFITAESGLTMPLWVHRAVLCRDYRVGAEELCRRHHEPIYIYLLCPSITVTHCMPFFLLRCLLLLWLVTSCRASSGYLRGQSCTLLLCDDTKTRLSGTRAGTNSNSVFCCLCMCSLLENGYCGLELE